jgi:hypothetical protein
MRRFLRMQEEHLSIAVVAKIILRKLKREPKPHLTIEALRAHAARTKADPTDPRARGRTHSLTRSPRRAAAVPNAFRPPLRPLRLSPAPRCVTDASNSLAQVNIGRVYYEQSRHAFRFDSFCAFGQSL